ncbi:Cof-type HAD-IIB family hydrolase [Methylobacterium aerolatum]|uniref:Cof subfamily protein (Haloacid dehalogenase superfamily) n=1 Tax=Methylobacterium aerolatum TaxID=418708 RepID=A0ABU0I4P2_9HYPH|nr:Cof-type HAD-IIB family hydrolase [Methylobacterium aerolatum]MDQ0449581.1 Cof subfamily protein (haloacid dehalogenase superfamily) [Methylobacterium aerolatum]GJD37525.1 Sugar phosphatase YidA [Methylobacterium aerolatum]
MTPEPIALVVSDVDGTLVTSDKRLAPATLAAVARLRAAGIGFTIASARPPVGLRSLVADLSLDLPVGAYNGATVIGPDLAVIEETLIPGDAAREAADRLMAEGVDVWVFAAGAWHLRDPQAPYTDLERRTLQAEPRVTADLGPLLAAASKIVGVSRDPAHLAACEGRLAAALGDRATVHRSQPYYLDVTPPGFDKGRFVTWLSRHLGIPPERIATFGDAANDIPMFARSGLAVAMGNGDAAVKAAARAVTADNDSDGFAEGVARFVLAPSTGGETAVARRAQRSGPKA